MSKNRFWSLPAALAGALLLLSCGGRAWAQPALSTESWANTDADFAAMNGRIRSTAPRNLLARSAVRLFIDGRDAGELLELTDGDAGRRGAEGRVFLNGSPTVVTVYLGAVKPIYEVGLFSFNIDSRANQMYTVRFADNSRQPGVPPVFSGDPACSTGPKVIGPNAGGMHSRFADPRGVPLATADWIEFRIWASYGLNAGEPAFKTRAKGAGVVVELEALGPAGDVASPEDVAYRQLLRTATREPEFVKKATWQETLIAAREALHTWENVQDYLALRQSPVTLGPWHVLGPLSARTKEVAELPRPKRWTWPAATGPPTAGRSAGNAATICRTASFTIWPRAGPPTGRRSTSSAGPWPCNATRGGMKSVSTPWPSAVGRSGCRSAPAAICKTACRCCWAATTQLRGRPASIPGPVAAQPGRASPVLLLREAQPVTARRRPLVATRGDARSFAGPGPQRVPGGGRPIADAMGVGK